MHKVTKGQEIIRAEAGFPTRLHDVTTEYWFCHGVERLGKEIMGGDAPASQSGGVVEEAFGGKRTRSSQNDEDDEEEHGAAAIFATDLVLTKIFCQDECNERQAFVVDGTTSLADIGRALNNAKTIQRFPTNAFGHDPLSSRCLNSSESSPASPAENGLAENKPPLVSSSPVMLQLQHVGHLNFKSNTGHRVLFRVADTTRAGDFVDGGLVPEREAVDPFVDGAVEHAKDTTSANKEEVADLTPREQLALAIQKEERDDEDVEGVRKELLVVQQVLQQDDLPAAVSPRNVVVLDEKRDEEHGHPYPPPMTLDTLDEDSMRDLDELLPQFGELQEPEDLEDGTGDFLMDNRGTELDQDNFQSGYALTGADPQRVIFGGPKKRTDLGVSLPGYTMGGEEDEADEGAVKRELNSATESDDEDGPVVDPRTDEEWRNKPELWQAPLDLANAKRRANADFFEKGGDGGANSGLPIPLERLENAEIEADRGPWTEVAMSERLFEQSSCPSQIVAERHWLSSSVVKDGGELSIPIQRVAVEEKPGAGDHTFNEASVSVAKTTAFCPRGRAPKIEEIQPDVPFVMSPKHGATHDCNWSGAASWLKRKAQEEARRLASKGYVPGSKGFGKFCKRYKGQPMFLRSGTLNPEYLTPIVKKVESFRNVVEKSEASAQFHGKRREKVVYPSGGHKLYNRAGKVRTTFFGVLVVVPLVLIADPLPILLLKESHVICLNKKSHRVKQA